MFNKSVLSTTSIGMVISIVQIQFKQLLVRTCALISLQHSRSVEYLMFDRVVISDVMLTEYGPDTPGSSLLRRISPRSNTFCLRSPMRHTPTDPPYTEVSDLQVEHCSTTQKPATIVDACARPATIRYIARYLTMFVVCAL